MPTVGTGESAKHFPYTPEGVNAAKVYAQRTGKPIFYQSSYRGGASKKTLKQVMGGA